ncbi:PAS domain-containing protein [Sulfurospirillum diekertiae]|uniref:Cyclic di-GMP phosphodiesterase n=1 Tax=Sulfurospirillum diekertiae TaxID=1854492 RepID=A0A290HQU1_9BACT|nr:putative cyclic di-GMP phosphodiesterase [Sulfurospirillum diekertiae]QIR76779.1 PAS domain-containing protein [Sulfurospirillum diekertiae]QIR79410.1 PAS domain-containing protein [Sulfurospirillum diekertiae]
MQTTYQMFIETIVPSDELIVSRTDLHGNITYANETFAHISGYEIDELIGKPHNIVRHPDMPHSVFRTLWQTLKQEQMWKGYVKNLRKDGGYYWVYAEISGVYKDGVLVEYKSLRAPIEEETKIKMQREYDEKCEKEEGKSRVVVYLKSDIVHKVETLAREKACLGDTIMNDILSDSLF